MLSRWIWWLSFFLCFCMGNYRGNTGKFRMFLLDVEFGQIEVSRWDRWRDWFSVSFGRVVSRREGVEEKIGLAWRGEPGSWWRAARNLISKSKLTNHCLNFGFPGSSAGKESACSAGDPTSVPGLGRSAGEGIGSSLQYSWASLLAQMVKNFPAVRGDFGFIPGLGTSPGGGYGNPLQHSCLENPHGPRSLVSCSPRGHKESDMTEWLSTAQP